MVDVRKIRKRNEGRDDATAQIEFIDETLGEVVMNPGDDLIGTIERAPGSPGCCMKLR